MSKQNPILYLFFPHQLTGEQAYMTSLFMESVLRALWRGYGDQMADFQGRVFPDEPSPWVKIYCKPEEKEEDGF